MVLICTITDQQGRIGDLNFLEGKVASERDLEENEQSLRLAQERNRPVGGKTAFIKVHKFGTV